MQNNSNYNPFNRLKLNKYHQLQQHHRSNDLRKKQRDLQRLLAHKGEQANPQKIQQLQEVSKKLQQRHKQKTKTQRKEFFLQKKYGPIMQVQLKKVKRSLRLANEQLAQNPQDQQSIAKVSHNIKHLLYIRHFPKDKKYISLFPNGQLAPEARKMQEEIMESIMEKRQQIKKFRERRLKVKQNKKKDDFFKPVEENS